ncbi:MAG: CDP-diacylglycerol--glycerol-3-phosphate 3-phosphatidyltransferase [Puniceicoccales bacterium]|jgi:CDP-diacylglycerol--glycerol-3-phosphate 3-phosphatidyltransferase|nr:CDP-diacylglycerol--glycerol-3-phosphate 3-phosphatidyltransferase [Puniceicoccales bacterium]
MATVRSQPVNGANIITLSRFPLLFVIVGLLYAPFPGSRSLAFVLYLFTGFTDWLDGYVARRRAIVSNFGKFMDALSDKILTLGLFIFFLTDGTLPPLFLFAVLLMLGREFLVTGLRLVAASRNVVIAAEWSGKIKTILLMVSIGALICARAMSHDFQWIPQIFVQLMHWFGIFLFCAGFYCTVDSGVRYLIRHRSVLTSDGGRR